MSKYINANTVIQELRETIEKYKDSEMFTRTVRAAENMILIIDRTPAADVVEVEPLKTYITNLISNIPQTDYVKDDYDAGFADALRIIYTHLCGADMRERKETSE